VLLETARGLCPTGGGAGRPRPARESGEDSSLPLVLKATTELRGEVTPPLEAEAGCIAGEVGADCVAMSD
jgi:hypothetical protein